MPLADLPIFSMIKTKMDWHNGRQNVLAQNISNADTPDYEAMELKTPSFSDLLTTSKAKMGLSTALTHNRHIEGLGLATNSFKGADGNDWEITPEGNAVVIEDQMIKIAENQMDYQMATTLYTKSLGMLRTAIGRR